MKLLSRLVMTGTLLSAFACSGGGPTDPGTLGATQSIGGGQGNKEVELPDPCTLLTPSEIESVIGNGVGEGSANEVVGTRHCSWASPQGNAVGRSVAIELQGPTEVYSARHLFDQKTDITEHPEQIRDIPGVGDGAYGVVKDLNSGTVVKVLKGDIILTVRVGEAEEMTEEHFTMATELAKKAVARL